MRFGWKTKVKNWGPELTVVDTEMHILDKDDTMHIKTIKGDWDTFGFSTEEPYALDGRRRADSYLADHEYIVTDSDLRIPRCNVKNVYLKDVNERQVQPTKQLRGIPDWHSMDWFCFFFMAGFFLFMSACTALAVFGNFKRG